ncbi:MAG: MFS transporter [Acidimicrobiia bacterium]
MSSTFRSLLHRNFRYFFAGQVTSVAGTWTQTIAQSWLVLDLSGNRPISVGIVTAMQFLPSLALGLWGGLLADRFDKRRLLMACQASMAVVAAVLAVVTLAGWAELWIVYTAAFLTGLALVPDTPARQSFISEMVPDEDLSNAVNLNSATFNAARIVGPAIAGGVLWAGGAGACFAVNALSYLAVIVALLRMRPAELRTHERLARGAGQLRDGIRYMWATPDLRAHLAFAAVMGGLGMSFQVVVPVLAKLTFGGTEATFSLLVAAQGVGALLGVLRLASRRPTGQTVTRAGVAFGLALCGAALVPSLVALVAVLVAVGWFMIVSLSASNAIVQLMSRAQYRGRVLALRGLFVLGGAPIGGVVSGWISQVAGPRWALAVAGSVTATVTLLLAPAMTGRRLPAPATIPTPAPAAGLVD